MAYIGVDRKKLDMSPLLQSSHSTRDEVWRVRIILCGHGWDSSSTTLLPFASPDNSHGLARSFDFHNINYGAFQGLTYLDDDIQCDRLIM